MSSIHHTDVLTQAILMQKVETVQGASLHAEQLTPLQQGGRINAMCWSGGTYGQHWKGR